MAFSLFVCALIVSMVVGSSGKRTKRPAKKSRGSTQGESSSSPNPESFQARCDEQRPGAAELPVGRNSNFRSDEAYYRNRNLFKHCTVMSERSIKIDDFPNTLLDRVINERNWGNLVSYSVKPNVNMVQEFYANADMYFSESGYIHCFVRRKFFMITPQSLARFFNAPRVNNPQFPFSDDDKPTLSAVASLLTGVNRAWDGIASTLKHSELTPDFAVLHVFVSANLCPVLHTSTVNKDKAYLMFALGSNCSIDLGSYLFKSILHACEKSKTNSSLPFGSLITSLCRSYRCEDLATDTINSLGPTYNMAAYNKRLTVIRGRNAQPQPPPQPQPEPQQGENVFSMENMWNLVNTINTNVTNIGIGQNELRELVTTQYQGLSVRIDGIDDRLAHYFNGGNYQSYADYNQVYDDEDDDEEGENEDDDEDNDDDDEEGDDGNNGD